MPPSSSEAAGATISATVAEIVAATPVFDTHTHLYDPAFGGLLLRGIDELLIYHCLVAESFRYLDVPCDQFRTLPRTGQADLIWNALFVEHSPISESCRGVLTTLNALGLDPRRQDLAALRRWFADWNARDYTSHCMELANVRRICMTNSPFDHEERAVWEQGFARDERFVSALRIDPLLLQWEEVVPQLQAWGYDASPELNAKTFDAVRVFLDDWANNTEALFVMASLPPTFRYPAMTPAARLLEEAVLPFCRDSGLPFSPMLGPRSAVKPGLRLAGDSMGMSDLQSLENMVSQFTDTRFLVTLQAREGQHELCVLARKWRNVHIFGCWWFTNIPSLIDEITRMRLELLGLSFTPQYSDARVIDQIIYKWRHSKEIIARVLSEKYTDLVIAGWTPSRAEIERDVRDLFGGAFERFLKAAP